MPDIFERVRPFIGAPFLEHGRTPGGWDCWGCAAWLRGELFGRPARSWAEVYGEADVRDAERVAALIEERLGAWQPVAPEAGAMVLLKLFSRPVHVGLMLTPRTFVHVMAGSQTALADVGSQRWPASRVAGFFDD